MNRSDCNDAAALSAARNHDFQRSMLDAVPAAAYLCDADGRLTAFNEHAAELWGRRPRLNDDAERFCGSLRLWSTDGKRIAHDECWMAMALREKQPYTAREAVVERPDGSRRTALAHAHPLYDDAGHLCGAMNVLVDVTAARQAESELRRTSHLLQAVADGTSDAVFVKDRNGRYLFFNEAAARFVGRPVADVLGQSDAAIFEPQSAQRVQEHDRLVMDSGRVQTDEEELTAAGVTRTYLVTKAPYRDEAGSVTGVIGISRDITQRKQAEDNLRASEERLRALIAAVPDMIFRLDPAGVFIDCKVEPNTELIAPPEVFLGKHYREVMPPSISDQITKSIDAGQRSGKLQTFEYELILPQCQQQQQWYEARLMAAAAGCTLVVARNVTPWKQAESALRQSEARLKLALATAEMGVWEWDLASDRVFWSPECYQILRNAAFDGTLAGFTRLVHRDDLARITAAQRQAIDQHTDYAAEFRVLAADDEVRWVTNLGRTEYDDDNRPLRMIGIVHDVTERKKLEEQFRQSQKMEAVGRLAGGVAHDFNNLLTVISGFSELLAMKLEPNSPLRASVQAIQDASGRAAGLTRQLLAFSRKQMLDPTVLNLNDVVRVADEMLQRLIGEDILMTVKLEPKLNLVTVDRGQIEQVIMNLVVNARDTMPHGGCLTIATRNVPVDSAATQAGDPEQGFVELAVSDTGHGMTDEIKARIFDPFFTTKELGKGTGLGLAVVHGIVSQSGGRVDVETHPGRGTTFRVLLPSAGSAATATPAAPPPCVMEGGAESILLVEDDDAVREFTLLALRNLGYRVFPARNGPEALDIAHRQRTGVDLLLSDVVMPEMSGPLLAEMLRVRHPALRVLFVSGYADDAIVERGLLQSTATFLHKPFAPQSLATKVREVLDDG